MKSIQDKVRTTSINTYSASNKLTTSTPIFQYAGVPLKINVNDELAIQIKSLIKNGSSYKGQFKVDFNYCNSVQNAQKISNFPELIDENETRMVSANMFTFRITDKQGSIIYSKQPLVAQQPIPLGISQEIMEEYKVFQTNSMDQNERWVQVGQIQVNSSKKMFQYAIPNKTDDQVVRNIEEFLKQRRQKLKVAKEEQFQGTLKRLFQCYQPYSRNKYQKFGDKYQNIMEKKGRPTYLTSEIRQIYFKEISKNELKLLSQKLINIYSQRLIPLDIFKQQILYKRFYLLPKDFMLDTLRKYQNFTEIQANLFAQITSQYNDKINQEYQCLKRKISRIQKLQLVCKNQQGTSCDQIRFEHANKELQSQKEKEYFSFSTALMNQSQYSLLVRRFLIRQFQTKSKFIFTNEPQPSQKDKALQISIKLKQQLKEQDLKIGFKQMQMPSWQKNLLDSVEWCSQQAYSGLWIPRSGLKIPKSRGKQLLLKEQQIHQKYEELLINAIQRGVSSFVKKYPSAQQTNLFCFQYLLYKQRSQDDIRFTRQNLRKDFTLLSSNSSKVQKKLQQLFQVEQKIQLQIQKKRILQFIFDNFQQTRISNHSSVINVLDTYQQNLNILARKQGELTRISYSLQIPTDNQKVNKFVYSLRGGGLWDDIKNSPALMRQFLARNGIQNINIDYLFPDTIALIKSRLSKQQIENQQRLYAQQKKKEQEQLIAQKQLQKYNLTRQSQLSKLQSYRKYNIAQSNQRSRQKAKDIEGILRETGSSLSTEQSNDDDSISVKQQKWQYISANVKSRINQFDKTLKQIGPITNQIKTEIGSIKKTINDLEAKQKQKLANIKPINDMIAGLQKKQKLIKTEQVSLTMLINQKRPLNYELNDISNSIQQNQALMREAVAIQNHLKSLQQISPVIKKYRAMDEQIQKSLTFLNSSKDSTVKMAENEKKLSQTYRKINKSVQQLQVELKKIQAKQSSLQFNKQKLQLLGISNRQITSLQQNYNDLKEIFSSLRESKGANNYQESFDRNYERWKNISKEIKK